ncbi:diadenosine tetraphosphate hydrolase [Candidatus Micrarchaeota archaeon CG10_big_fil_rev_8_21_14_0_10_45_29]|nr:MAG: diadenosine tetraphosphate hydrolase [Candidatus Micrarchaeota archaeon CG10_big_fil_rev_8_21_14_0_10_45_29]
MQEHSCGFVLFRQVDKNHYYLLMHYKAGHWDFPKGHVEEKESIEQTAKRELAEETGIRDVHVLPGFLYEYDYEFGKRGGRQKSKRVTFMLASTSESATRLSHEHKGARWVPYARALKMLTFENAGKMLVAAEAHLQKLKADERAQKEGSAEQAR